MGEFELINTYFQRPELTNGSAIALVGGDDCALLNPPPNQQLAISVDTFVADVHFFSDASPYDIATRCFAASFSDLAAMGAVPVAYTLCLTMPQLDQSFLQSFSDGLVSMSQRYGVALVGGDTTKGPLTISMQVIGWVPKDKALQRNGAKAGDGIYVSGYLGDAGGGLIQLREQSPANHYLVQRFYHPTPRFALGQWLQGRASSAIDVSDGLLQDLGHILQGSNVGASIELSQLPLSTDLRQSFDAETCLSMALTAGEDFELCFTLSQDQHTDLLMFAEQSQLPLAKIGMIYEDRGLRTFSHGASVPLPQHRGWQHFSGTSI